MSTGVLWVVPISAESQCIAHLVTYQKHCHRLCAKHRAVTLKYAVVVDTDNYVRKCVYCKKAFENSPNGYVLIPRQKPDVSTKEQLMLVRRTFRRLAA